MDRIKTLKISSSQDRTTRIEDPYQKIEILVLEEITKIEASLKTESHPRKGEPQMVSRRHPRVQMERKVLKVLSTLLNPILILTLTLHVLTYLTTVCI